MGLVCSEDDLPMEEWFAKDTKDGGSRQVHNHIGSLSCLLQSKSSPVTVDEKGELYDSALNNRTKRIRLILLQDPARRPLSDPDHRFWGKVVEGK